MKNQWKNKTSSWITLRNRHTSRNSSLNVVFGRHHQEKNGFISSFSSFKGRTPQLCHALLDKLGSIGSLFSSPKVIVSLNKKNFFIARICCHSCEDVDAGWSLFLLSIITGLSSRFLSLSLDLSVVLETASNTDPLQNVSTCEKKQKSYIRIIHTYNYNHFKLLLILSNDIETNPGPISSPNDQFQIVDKKNLFILSYNVCGCKDFKKLKRINNFFQTTPFKNNCIINLQETHLNESELDKLQYQWKYGLVQSPAQNNSGGVAILYNKTYFDEILETKSYDTGRICTLTTKKDDDVYFFINVYAPNNNSDMITLIEQLEEVLWESLDKYPNSLTFISGDFNLILDPEIDSINRKQTSSERNASNRLKEVIARFGLTDSYRVMNPYGGFTWGRNNPTYIRSRLDLIFVSKAISHNIVSSNTYQTPNESDHKLLVTELNLATINYGPGIIRANSDLLKDPEINTHIKNYLDKIIKNTSHLDPHNQLDYVKMKLKEELIKEGKKKANRNKTNLYYSNTEIERLNKSLDIELAKHDLIKCKSHNKDCYQRIDTLKEALDIAKLNIEDIKEEESQRLIFRSKAKWAEKGEKSNKYFLNLLKDRQRKMQIRKITSLGTTYYKQDEISKAITAFYSNLYDKQPLKPLDTEDKMFKDLPRLNDEDKNNLKMPLTLNELKETLSTCNESAPGPDGLTYETYKQLWDQMGPLIHNSWTLSNKIGITSNSQRHSVITLLEKKGKDKTKIENLRPISLSNCDIKLCTKTIASRTNKVLCKLINSTQTGYVPNRQVNDNSRYLEELIQYYKNNDKLAYLITLDAQKAFDSVDHAYMANLLRLYNFPEEYIHHIKTLYTGLNATVLVNGYCGKKIEIKQSVKQGDAIKLNFKCK